MDKKQNTNGALPENKTGDQSFDYQANNPNYTGYGNLKDPSERYEHISDEPQLQGKPEREDLGRAKVNENDESFDNDHGEKN